MNWFKSKSYPAFWAHYLEQIKIKSSQSLDELRFVVFDTETTGLNIKTDRILSIGCVAIKNLKIKVSDQLECYLDQDRFNAESVKIHGLLKDGQLAKVSEETAIENFINYLGNGIVVAHHAAFDVAMINQALSRMNLPKLKNRIIDTGHLFYKTKINQNKEHFSLDELAKQFNIPLHDRHTASGDAFITALLFLKIIAHLKQDKDYSLSDLIKSNKRIGLL